MGEKRLLEIASVINILDGPLLILSYLMSLRYSDMYLFLKYVRGSKYKELNFYDSVKLFSRDYLKNKQEVLNDSFLQELGFSKKLNESLVFSNNFTSDYVSNLGFPISSLGIVNTNKKR